MLQIRAASHADVLAIIDQQLRFGVLERSGASTETGF
jgi:hypothetical protein